MKPADYILSKEEIRSYLERNNRDDIRPAYECWSGGGHQGPRASSRPGEPFRGTHAAWRRRLHTKPFRVQSRGQKAARLVERPVYLQRRGRRTGEWIFVPLQSDRR